MLFVCLFVCLFVWQLLSPSLVSGSTTNATSSLFGKYPNFLNRFTTSKETKTWSERSRQCSSCKRSRQLGRGCHWLLEAPGETTGCRRGKDRWNFEKHPVRWDQRKSIPSVECVAWSGKVLKNWWKLWNRWESMHALVEKHCKQVQVDNKRSSQKSQNLKKVNPINPATFTEKVFTILSHQQKKWYQ